MPKEQKELALSPYRALDLTDEKGFLCGRILGDLGADVIKIEPPGGEPSRRIGPFYKDIPDPEKSFYWFAYNTNKRGITLNIETGDGREIFKRLVGKADFVIESFAPGYMEKLGLGYSALSKINPGVIMTSITHFGQAGPYKDYKGSDIVDLAMSGYMYVTGDPDRPPVRIGVPQVYLHAGLDAAIGTMIAFHHRQLTGEGQWIDASAHSSAVKLPIEHPHIHWEGERLIIRRQGSKRERGGTAPLRHTWECKEGAVCFELATGLRAEMTRALLQWMEETGMNVDFLKSLDWENLDTRTISKELIDQIEGNIAKFCKAHTATEIYNWAKKKRFFLYPVSTVKDLMENPQLAAREFWEEVEHPELGTTLTYPGAFVKLSETPCSIRRRAPLIGEHNSEVYGELLGISQSDLVTLKQANII